MANWLNLQLKNKTCPGLQLVEGNNRTFRIPWCNAKSGGLRPGGEDTNVIIAWARHKSYQGTPDNENDLSNWKGKFRNALNRCQDIKRLENLTVKNKFIVCEFTEEFLAKLKLSYGQCRKRNSDECTDFDSVSIVSGGDRLPMIKKLNTSLPPEIVRESVKSNLVNVQSSISSFHYSQYSKAPSTLQQPITPPQCDPWDNGTGCIRVDIMYGIREKRCVKSVKLSNTTPICRIGSFDIPNLSERLSVEGEIRIPFPKIEELKHHSFSKSERSTLKTIFKDMERGIILKHDGSCIFIQRRSAIKVYFTDGKCDSKPLSRETDLTQANILPGFNLREFQKEMEEYVQGRHKRHPKPWFFLTVGHDIEKDKDNPLEGCAVYVQITHLLADKLLKNAQERVFLARPPLCSNEDGIDMMLANISNPDFLAMLLRTIENQNQDKMLDLSDLTDCSNNAFSETVSLQRENYSLTQNLTSCDNHVMSVEIYYSGCLVRCIMVPETATRCRIFSGPFETQMIDDNFSEDGSFEVRLPDVWTTDKLCETTRKAIQAMLPDLARGVHLIYNRYSIYAERRTILRVFETDNKTRSCPLKRRSMNEKPEPTHIFDFVKFTQDLASFKNGHGIPNPYALLTIGHEIEPGEDNPLQNVLFHIKVTHTIADFLQRNVLEASDRPTALKYSMPDSMDKTIKSFQELAVGAD